MGKKGKLAWIPKDVLDEISNIKVEEEIDGQAEAFRKMVKFSKVGRMVKKKDKGGRFDIFDGVL